MIGGIEKLRPAPALSFFIKRPSGRKLIFGLGTPGDISVLSEAVTLRLQSVNCTIESKDPAELLVARGIPLASIEAVVWR